MHVLPLGWPVHGETELAGGGAEGEQRRERVWVQFRACGAQLEGGEAVEWLDGAMRDYGGRSARARSRRPWRTVKGGRRRGSRATAGLWGYLYSGEQLGEGSGVWGRLVWSGAIQRRAGGASSSAAHGGAAWQLRRAPGTRASVGRCQGAGQVALEGFPRSTWPQTRRGQGPPVAYGWRNREKQRGDEDEGLFVISDNSGTTR